MGTFGIRRPDLEFRCTTALLCACLEYLSIADALMNHAWTLTSHEGGRVYNGLIGGLQLELRRASMDTSPDEGEFRYTVTIGKWGMKTTEDLILRYRAVGPNKTVVDLEIDVDPPFLFCLVPWVYRQIVGRAADYGIRQAQRRLDELAHDPGGLQRILEPMDWDHIMEYKRGLHWTRGGGQPSRQQVEWVRVEMVPIDDSRTRVASSSNLPGEHLDTPEMVLVGDVRSRLVERSDQLFAGGNAYAASVRSTPRKAEAADTAKALGDRFRADGAAIGQELWHRYLFGQVKGRLVALQTRTSARRLLVYAEGAESHLPWELLHDDQGFLWRSMGVVRAGSGRPQQSDGSAPFTLTGALIVAADVRGGDDSTIASEAEALEGMLAASGLKRGVALDSLVGPQATKTAIRDHIATRRYNVLHFCGHSEYDAASPGGSYLEVHDEHDPRKARKLMADDIKAWYQDYGLQVVLLNSCSAAASPESGSMIGGIAHAFVGLGIPYVIGPRCEITQDAAQKLALAFYESLIDGSDPVGAVSAARQAVYEGFDSVDPAWGSVIAYSP